MNSYHSNQPWVDQVVKGIYSEFDSNNINVEFYTEYLDAKRYEGDEETLIFPYVEQLFSHKYHAVKFDVIIASDDSAFLFLLPRHQKLFPGTPIVVVGINVNQELLLAKPPGITGLLEEKTFHDTIALCLRIHPKTEYIVLINDHTLEGVYNSTELKKAISEHDPSLQVIELTNLTLEELGEKMQSLPKNSILINPCYSVDTVGKNLSRQQTIEFINRHCDLPIYWGWDLYIGWGVVGGVVTNGHLQGEQAAKIALRVLHGESVDQIPIRSCPNAILFDYNLLIKHSIPLSVLPENSLLLNQPVSIYYKYKFVIWIIFISLWLQSIAILLLMIAIVRRKRVESALRDSEEKYRELVENANSIILRMDTDGKVTFFNEFAERFFDYTKSEILGQNVLETIIPKYDTNGRDMSSFIFDLIRFPEKYTQNENENQRKDGSKIWVSWTNKVVLNDFQVPTEILCIGTDITARKQAEEALRESRDYFMTVFESCLAGIAIVDHTTQQFMQVNPSFLRILGYTEKELLTKTVPDITHPDDWAIEQKSIQEHLEGKSTSVALTKRFIQKNGGIRWVYIEGNLITQSGKQAALATVVDITERKRAEEEKDKLQAQLMQAQKMESVGRLAGGVAHDFNNMLGVILGHTELLLMNIDPSEPIHADLEDIKKAAQRSADLTRQLLAFARKQTVQPKVLNLNETVASMLKMLQRLMGEDINLAWQPEKDLWTVKIDPSQIDQILANLCVNARDAIAGVGFITIETGNGTFSETYCVDHTGFMPGEFVVLTVRDSGCGMNKNTLANLFDPFFTTKRVGEGTGLGLATVYGAVKQNNGFITVSSELDHGTTFNIFLPRYVGPIKKISSMGESDETLIGGQEIVLLVEDEASILKMTKTMLEKLGYTVLAAGTPSEAIRLVGEYTGSLHLVITDVVMPEMNGRTLATHLLFLYPNLKHLFMSGYTADVIAHQGVLDEGVNFIQKPFSIETLAAKVREVLDKKTAFPAV